jgi:monovalent cation:H+ antiporter, CPA1 family
LWHKFRCLDDLMDQFLTTETLIIELLLIASLVAIAVHRLRIPYTVALVVVGLIITSQSPLEIELTPELILTLFVPPLVFEAAFHLNFRELQRNLPGILLLAVPGVILTTLIVAGVLVVGNTLSLPLALVFGALIAATDPLAVVALFRSLGVPKRLSVLIEGESLLNDGTAIVLFNLMLLVALTGRFNLVESISSFLRVAIGGTVVGLVLGWIISRLIARVDDYLIETTLTTVLAFGSYLIAEQLHFSGVLAVVAAGLVNGNMGPQGMSPTTRIVLFNFWEYVAFLANSMVFLMIGLQVSIPALLATWQPVMWAILAVLLARLVVVYGLSWIAKLVAEPIPFKWQHVLNWGGLRGAICLALALSLPASLGSERDLLRVMAFGVVLFTLLVQSTTMRSLIRFLKIITRSEMQVEYEMRHARLASLRIADTRLDRMHIEGLLSTHTWERLKQFITQNAASLAASMRELLLADPALEAEELDTGWRELNRAQRSALLSLRRDGVISEDVFEDLTAEVDARLSEGYPAMPESVDVRTQFLEVTIPSNSLAVGKSVVEIHIPRAAVLVSIKRSDEIIIPRGDTRLLSGDVVTILSEIEAITDVRDLLLSPNDSPEINSSQMTAADPSTEPKTVEDVDILE